MYIKYKKHITIGVILFAIVLIVISLSNSTYALFSNDTYGVNTNMYTTGMLSITSSSKSDNISLTDVLPMSDEEGAQTTPYVFTVENVGNLDYKFDIKLLSTGDSSTTFSSQYIKLQIDNGEVVTLSSLSNSVIKSDVTLLAGEHIDISIRIWLSEDTPNSEIGKSFNSNIVTDGQAVYTESNNVYNSLVNYIINLYTSGNPTLITHYDTDGNSVNDYYYSYQDTDQTWGLMNDGLKVDTTQDETTTGLAATVTGVGSLISGTEGNIRYFGPSDSVNNYIYFNCETYPDTNCELWRIIGIVDGKVKIIRNDSIESLAWDQDKNQDSSLTTYSNNWETSSLQLMLNNSYYNGDTAGTITYLSGSLGTTSKSLNMSNIGIKNDTTRNMISESIWYLGGKSSMALYSNDIYTYERTNTVGTTIYSGNPFTITANIGLMYASDYGYATDLSKCSDYLSAYNSSTDDYACRANNWLFNSAFQWLITPYSTTLYSAWYVVSSGLVGSNNVHNVIGVVRPVLYLNSELGIESEGEGTSTNPYRINVS